MVNQTTTQTRQTSRILEDAKIDVKLKIAALWAAVMFIFAYGDIFAYFRTGYLQDIMTGTVSGNQLNQVFLMGISVYVAIPSLMVFLSLVLKPQINRWANIILSLLFTAANLLSCIGETWAYYFFMTALESVLLLAVAWYAWTWPRTDR
ncbi:MAG TPA: DUF6326 family protein [Methanocella sp.]|nr:DUF6326 family protein [Methanocella sp.]